MSGITSQGSYNGGPLPYPIDGGLWGGYASLVQRCDDAAGMQLFSDIAGGLPEGARCAYLQGVTDTAGHCPDLAWNYGFGGAGTGWPAQGVLVVPGYCMDPAFDPITNGPNVPLWLFLRSREAMERCRVGGARRRIGLIWIFGL